MKMPMLKYESSPYLGHSPCFPCREGLSYFSRLLLQKLLTRLIGQNHYNKCHFRRLDGEYLVNQMDLCAHNVLVDVEMDILGNYQVAAGRKHIRGL